MAIYLTTIVASIVGSKVFASKYLAVACANAKADMAPRVCEFVPPVGPKVAAMQVLRNLSRFWLHYTLTLWAILFLTLLKRPMVLWTLLLVMALPACLQLSQECFISSQRERVIRSTEDSEDTVKSITGLLGKVCPPIAEAYIRDASIRPIIVFLVELLIMVTLVELALSLAVFQFLLSLGIGLPVVLVHAVFTRQ